MTRRLKEAESPAVGIPLPESTGERVEGARIRFEGAEDSP